MPYEHSGWCPIGTRPSTFTSEQEWYRDHLQCSCCADLGGSLPRDRAAAWVMDLLFPGWPDLRVHEIGPTGTAFSRNLAARCHHASASHYFPDRPLGSAVDHLVNQDAENLTFDSASVDVMVSLDVLEHLNRPDRAVQEIDRVLRPGGAHIFTAPTYGDLGRTRRRAVRSDDGSIEHIHPPVFHGDPVSDEGALVFFDYGYDLPALIKGWSGCDTAVIRFCREDLGVIGEFTEVYVTYS